MLLALIVAKRNCNTKQCVEYVKARASNDLVCSLLMKFGFPSQALDTSELSSKAFITQVLAPRLLSDIVVIGRPSESEEANSNFGRPKEIPPTLRDYTSEQYSDSYKDSSSEDTYDQLGNIKHYVRGPDSETTPPLPDSLWSRSNFNSSAFGSVNLTPVQGTANQGGNWNTEPTLTPVGKLLSGSSALKK